MKENDIRWCKNVGHSLVTRHGVWADNWDY
jgi:hypothetical protein